MGPFADLAVGSSPGGCGLRPAATHRRVRDRPRRAYGGAAGADLPRSTARPPCGRSRTSRCRTEADAARVDLQVLAAGVGGNGAAGIGDGGDWAACRAMAVEPLSMW